MVDQPQATPPHAAQKHAAEAASFPVFVRGLLADGWATVRSWSPLRWFGTILVASALGAAFIFINVPDLASLRAAAANLGGWFVVALWAGYVVFTLFPLPRTIWTVAAGLLLGPWLGMTVALSALTVSAGISFLAVRHLLGGWLTPRLTHPTIAMINAHLARRGWYAVANLRMVAGVPFSLLNYVAGLTAIPLGQFLAATALGSIPTTALGVFFGDALTGRPSGWILAAMAGLAAIGLAGIARDIYRARSLKSSL